jgi:uncharacterized membrane protein
VETEVVAPRWGALHGARRRSREAAGSLSAARVLVVTSVAAYAALLAGAAVLHYLVFRTPHSDLGNMAQAVWSTAHGHFLGMTAASGHDITRLGVHVEPFLALLVPLWWLWGSPMMLVVVQAVVVSTGAIPVYWLARKHLRSERAAVHFALAYLLFPATQFNAFDPSSGFHAVSLSIPLILFAIWFLDEDRLVAFVVVALLAGATREQIPAAVGCLGIWYSVRRGRRLAGLAILSVGVMVTIANFLVVIPAFAVSGINPFAGRYKQVGATPRGMAHKLVSDPIAFVHAAATTHKLVYVVLLFAPFLGFWIREPLLLFGAVPQLAIDLFSARPEQTEIPYHYTAGIVPFVVAASVLGAARFRGDPGRLSFYTLVAVACTAVYSPLLMIRSDIAALSSPTRAAKARALSLVPASVPVSASNQLGASLSARRYSFTFPTIGSATWVVVDKADPTYRDAATYLYAIRALESSQRWKIVFSSYGVAVIERRHRP